MSKVENSGQPTSPVWIIAEDPYAKDEDKGYAWSSGLGYVFKKLLSLSGLDKLCEPYIYLLKPCLGATYDYKTRFAMLLTELENYKPPLICPVNVNLVESFCPHLVSRSQRKAILKKYSGSLLTTTLLGYSHYVVPLYPPDFVASNYEYLEIAGYIDMGHVKDELAYYQQFNTLNPLVARRLTINPSYDALMSWLYRAHYDFGQKNIEFLSVDIETIRPRKSSIWHTMGHPGYSYTIALATSATEAISFPLWDWSTSEAKNIWRILYELMNKMSIIGQNFFSFDAHLLEALGYRFNFDNIKDTLIRHHILWPALEHKLQFQTKQYTRENFYKDEGKSWNPRQKDSLLRYNALDAAVTYEIYLAQEQEFKQRSYLA